MHALKGGKIPYSLAQIAIEELSTSAKQFRWKTIILLCGRHCHPIQNLFTGSMGMAACLDRMAAALREKPVVRPLAQ